MRNPSGLSFEDLVRRDSQQSKEKMIFGESELNPNWQVWVKVLGLIQETKTLVLVGKCEYSASPTLTWLHIYAQILNRSWRKDNPIKIVVKSCSEPST